MPSFDVVSEINHQEVKNAVDQARREVTTRYDFKDTGTVIDYNEKEIKLHTASEDRLRALRELLEEKFVRRGVSLKTLDYANVEAASGNTVRQTAKLVEGISSDKAKEINKFIKELNLKGIQSQTQGDQVRVTGKKRDDLQEAIAKLKDNDFEVPLQFNNFRE
jgi:uncharacterized protein YajQ (UPF0234 family)